MERKDIINNKKTGWLNLNEVEKKNVFEFSEGYMDFLNKSKTEREFVKNAKELLDNNGFINIEEKGTLNIGDKVYYINRNKCVYIAVIGKEVLSNGLNIVGSHIDSPRLDLKPNPMYEDDGFAYFKTQYYGGIKKYQWTTIPLSIHGVIIKKTGEKVEVNIGEDESDPIFTITDLLPHLAKEQEKKTLGDGIEGENLDLLIGSIPFDEEKDSIKYNILSLLNEKYGIKEIDFLSSELEIVPAFKARSLGFDKSMVAAYGQDDKVCSYCNLEAILNTQNPEKTCITILADKEEIGSVGNTGMYSETFDMFINELLNKKDENYPGALNKVYNNSKMLSADVDAGYDPIYKSASEINNASFLGRGIVLNKYTGSRGKSGASDANAEYMAYVRNILEKNNIKYQVSTLGKIDLGGGGTIAYILANKGIEVVDAGIGVLSMHAPYEVTSKFDIYSAYNFYYKFFMD